jgi:NAD(P)-dependent dehydrogenase (short-subunit alcohol dehydrogenase family)
MTFTPRRAIVTASDLGIGRATAVALAQARLDIGVTWHSDQAGADETAVQVRAAGVKAEVTRLDTSALDRCGDVIDELAGRLGGVDVFVNNAGTGSAALALEMTAGQWRQVVAPTSTARSCASSARPAARSQPAAAAASSRSPACTSTSRASAPQPMTRPSTAWAA